MFSNITQFYDDLRIMSKLIMSKNLQINMAYYLNEITENSIK